MTATVTGVEDIQKNLDAALAGINGQTEKGVFLAAQFIKGEAQELTPVDEGTLRLSAFASKLPSKDEIAYAVGYTAHYAGAVHEAPMKLKGQPRQDFKGSGFGGGSGKGNYWDGGENKFLEKAVARNLSTIVNIIKKNAKGWFSGA